MITINKVKKPRSLSLTPEVEDKLLKLCERLGVNPHAYLLNEVGKAVNRDYLAFQVADNQQNALADFLGKMESAVQSETKPKEPETVIVLPKPDSSLAEALGLKKD